MFAPLCEALGGIAILLYGMHLAGQGLQGPGAGHIRSALALMTRGRVRAALSGALLAFGLQSSSAATAILLGLVDSSLIGVSAALCVVLGAGIGPALTVEILSFDPTSYAFLATALGAFMVLFAPGETGLRRMGRIVLGFSLLFHGMDFMGHAARGIVLHPGMTRILNGFVQSPIESFLFAVVLTSVLQSSVATLGLAMTLVRELGIDPAQAAPLVLGANVGTCSTALMASLRAGPRGRGVAWAYLGFKIIGALAAFPVAPAVVGGLARMPGLSVSPAMALAHGHVLFNVALVLLFLPWTRRLGRKMTARFEARRPEVDRDEGAADSSFHASALKGLQGRVHALGEGTVRLLTEFGALMTKEDLRSLDRLDRMGGALDRDAERDLSRLARWAGRVGAGPASQEAKRVFRMALAYRSIARRIRQDMAQSLRLKAQMGLDFSIQGEDELRSMLDEALSCLNASCLALAGSQGTEAGRVHEAYGRVGEIRSRCVDRHRDRLSRGIKEDRLAGSIYWDVLDGLLDICRNSRRLRP